MDDGPTVAAAKINHGSIKLAATEAGEHDGSTTTISKNSVKKVTALGLAAPGSPALGSGATAKVA